MLYLASAMTGLDRGIRILSNVNLLVACTLLAFTLLVGPTSFLFDVLTTTLGDYLQNPVAVGAYALAVAAVSALEVVLFRCAYRDGLLRRVASTPLPREGVVAGKWASRMALAIVQIGFAMAAGTLLFRIDWGPHWRALLLVCNGPAAPAVRRRAAFALPQP